MSFSLNKVQLIGKLGKDAEHRFTTSNNSVSSFSVATDHSYKGKDGNWVNDTTWHNVVAFGLSDFMKNALKQGKQFFVEGRLAKRDYTDKDNVKRYVTEIIAERLIPLDNTKAANGNAPAADTDTQVGNPVDENDDLPF